MRGTQDIDIKAALAPTKGSPDYDIEGYTAKYGPPGTVPGQHVTDEFKLPNHNTFSTESQYSTPYQTGGEWKSPVVGNQRVDEFYPSAHNLKNETGLKQHFIQQQPVGTNLMLPKGIVRGQQRPPSPGPWRTE